MTARLQSNRAAVFPFSKASRHSTRHSCAGTDIECLLFNKSAIKKAYKMCMPFSFLKGRSEVSLKNIVRQIEIFRKFRDILGFLETFWDIYRFLEAFNFREKAGRICK